MGTHPIFESDFDCLTEMIKVSLRMILLCQWVLAIGSLSSHMTWLPAGYQWAQFSIIGLGVWSIIERDSVEAIMMYTLATIISTMLDIIYVSTSFNGANKDSSLFKLSAAAVIIHILVKPVQTLILYQIYKDRGGEYGFNIGHVLPGSGAYENIGDDEADSFTSNTYKPMTPLQSKAVPQYQSWNKKSNISTQVHTLFTCHYHSPFLLFFKKF